MKLFGLNKNRAETVPAEVQDYYRSERRERTGLAWLLALGTLIVTLLIAAGLFFGGRWVYRKVSGTNKAATQQQEQGVTSSTNTDQTKAGETPQAPASNQQTPSAGGQQQQAPPASSTPAPQTLVNTGPTDELEQE